MNFDRSIINFIESLPIPEKIPIVLFRFKEKMIDFSISRLNNYFFVEVMFGNYKIKEILTLDEFKEFVYNYKESIGVI